MLHFQPYKYRIRKLREAGCIIGSYDQSALCPVVRCLDKHTIQTMSDRKFNKMIASIKAANAKK